MFNNIPKSCATLRPAAPPKPISWSLGKVLALATSMDNDSIEIKRLSQKCLFLLAMASGARLSKLVALVRGKDHIQILQSGEALLFPDPVFLAKNELPNKRWGPWRIPPLVEDTSLCPVTCLRAYLARTPNYQSGQLFRGDTGSKLTLNQIRAKLLYFIKTADPTSVPAGHDVRKVATSINYFEFMDFADLCHYTGWKSPRVFYKCYLKQIGEVRHGLVAAGGIVRPAPAPSDPDSPDSV